jgi:polygalacturonase
MPPLLNAKGDGKTLDTEAIQNTIDSVNKSDGTIDFLAGQRAAHVEGQQ